MNKQLLGYILRKIRLYKFFDYLRYLFLKLIKYKHNKNFINNNPSVVLPPDYLMYESFQLDYKKYYDDSIKSAEELLKIFEKYIVLKNVKILDWGCGPARIIRHFPSLLEGSNCKFFGTDYNRKTIEWCIKNIRNVTFKLNNIAPPMEYESNTFDIVYGISIFTHLSEQMHYEWFNELLRVTKKNGIIYFTTHGKSFRNKLIEKEKNMFDADKIVVRANVTEGHRTYTSFHPKKFILSLIANNEILEFIEGVDTGRPQQDIWIVRKVN